MIVYLITIRCVYVGDKALCRTPCVSVSVYRLAMLMSDNNLQYAHCFT